MNEDKQIPEFNSYDEMAEFWDTHSLADYWEQTEPAEFEISPQARRRYLVSVDRDLISRIQRVARIRGLSTESLVNLLLEQRLHEIDVEPVVPG
jgi:predicted DNA binding CopG/RHH family protein